jgi:hypothetical protein
MTSQPLVQQLCRMLGRDVVAAALGADPTSVSTLTVEQGDAIEALVAEHRAQFVVALVAEAAENDDVSSTDAALGYAKLRLGDFAALLSDRLRMEIELQFQEMTADWG